MELSVKNIIGTCLNNSFGVAICTLLAIAFKINYDLQAACVGSDYSIQAMEAKNFIEGHGFTISRVMACDLNKVVYQSQYVWAIGLSILLVPLYYVTGNMVHALIAVQIVSSILLLVSIIRLFKVLGVTKTIISLFMLYSAFALFYRYFNTTDNLSAAFYILAVSYVIVLCKSNGPQYLKELWICVLLFFSIAFRYAYIPNASAIPAFLLIYGVIKKNRTFLYSGVRILTYTLMPVMVLFHFFKVSSVHFSFIDKMTQGNIHWSILKLFTPFPSNSFFNFSLIYKSIPLGGTFRLLHFSEYICSILIVAYVCWYFIFRRKTSGDNNSNAIDGFLAFVVVSFSVITAFLVLNSLSTGDIGAAAISQPRLFIIQILFTVILYFVILNNFLKEADSGKVINYFAPGLLILSFVYNVSFIFFTNESKDKVVPKESVGQQIGHAQFPSIDKYEKYYWNNPDNVLYGILKNDRERNPGNKIIFCSYKPQFLRGATAYANGAFNCFKFDSIVNRQFKVSDPVILYVLMPDSETINEKSFVESFNAQAVLKCPEGYVYRIMAK